MKIWHKILVAPAVAIVFLLALGALCFHMLNTQNNVLEELATTRLAGLQAATAARDELGEVHSSVYRLFTWIGNYDEEQIRQQGTTLAGRVDAVAANLRARGERADLEHAQSEMLAAVLPKITKYRKLVYDAIDISSIEVAMGAMAMQAADMHFQEISKDMAALVELEKTLAQQSMESAGAAFRRTIGALIVILAVAVTGALLVALAMSRAIVRPLHAAMQVAERIAAGDLAADVQVRGRDETAQLLGALARMLGNLRGLVGQVADGARTVADTSAQIAQGNLDLSQRTEEQAGTLEETASSMEELTSTVGQNAATARQASELAVDASEVARRGGQAVGEVVRTMSGISESSRKIGDIIGVIDGIAFQTNILALNAAVEAARAGEQGRGFAVVASEVRSLAQRSAEAAKEIKGLIGDSVVQVEVGSRQVDAAGRTMEEIVASVKKVSELIAEIAAASQEQSSGIEQVNAAITQMDQVVQQNASLVEEAAAATESMKTQAQALLRSVARFRLQERTQPAPQGTHAPAVAVTVAERPHSAVAPDAATLPLLPTPVAAMGPQWREF